jgi:hypothetical protein
MVFGGGLPFSRLPEDAAHFSALMAWLFQHAGDSKPNLLNADLIPFTYLEAADVWDYAPHYVFTEQLGSVEALVLMAGAALAYARGTGDWSWFERLWRFMLADNLVALDAGRIRALSANYQVAGVKNLVRVFYADYDQDNSRYWEAGTRPQWRPGGRPRWMWTCAMTRRWCVKIRKWPSFWPSACCSACPPPGKWWTWKPGSKAPVEIGDTLAVTSPFHGFDQEEFRGVRQGRGPESRRVSLNLARPFRSTWAWAVDAPGSDYDSHAIDQPSKLDENWAFRTYAG